MDGVWMSDLQSLIDEVIGIVDSNLEWDNASEVNKLLSGLDAADLPIEGRIRIAREHPKRV